MKKKLLAIAFFATLIMAQAQAAWRVQPAFFILPGIVSAEVYNNSRIPIICQIIATGRTAVGTVFSSGYLNLQIPPFSTGKAQAFSNLSPFVFATGDAVCDYIRFPIFY